MIFLSKPPKSMSIKGGPPSLSPWIQKHLESDELCYVTTLSRLNTHFLYTITTSLHRWTLPPAPHPNMFVSELSLSKQTLPSCYNCMHSTDLLSVDIYLEEFYFCIVKNVIWKSSIADWLLGKHNSWRRNGKPALYDGHPLKINNEDAFLK